MFLFWGGSLRLPNNSLLVSHCGGSRNLQRRRSVGWCSRVCATVEACTCWFGMCSPLGGYLGSQVAAQSASDEQRRDCVHDYLQSFLTAKTHSGVDRSSSNVSIGLLPFKCFSLITFLSPRISVAETSVSGSSF